MRTAMRYLKMIKILKDQYDMKDNYMKVVSNWKVMLVGQMW